MIERVHGVVVLFGQIAASRERRLRDSGMCEWRNGHVDPKLLDPVCRLSGSGDAALGNLVSARRPQWKDIKGTIGMDTMPRA